MSYLPAAWQRLAWASCCLVLSCSAEVPATTGTATAALTDPPLTWQEATLVAAPPQPNDYFGDGIALDANTALVGADGDNFDTGASYLFVRSGTSWTQQDKVSAPDPGYGDCVGYTGALRGSTAVLGAFCDNDWEGSAYTFVRSGKFWNHQQKLTGSDAIADDEFAVSVSLSANTALIGADEANGGLGAAYVFVRSGSTFNEQQKLTAADGADDGGYNDAFGESVSIDGDTAVIGAIRHEYMGAAYVFVRSGTTWSEQQQLRGSDVASSVDFGEEVAVSGDTVVATTGTLPAAAAYVFVRSGASFGEQQKITAPSGLDNDAFGISIAVDGDNLLVAAPNVDHGGGQFGSAYLFQRSGTTWSSMLELTAADGASLSWGLVALSGNVALVSGDDRVHAFTFGQASGSCATGLQCVSGYCADGICCDSECSGPCESCLAAVKGSGVDGECGPVPANTDPRNGCTQDGVGSCFTGTCDGAGACAEYAAGTECAPAACPTETSANAADTCNALGQCVVTPVVECDAGYRCIVGSCTASCKDDGDCASNAYCTSAGECALKRASGDSCEQPGQCSSSFCTDGLCCDSACDAQCEACNEQGTEGKCVAVQGEPRGDRTACPDAAAGEPCKEAACDGLTRDRCNGFPGSDVSCAEATCTEEGASAAARCDGEGNCAISQPLPCGAYRCGETACKTSCASDEDCSSAARCEGGQCRKTSQCSSDGLDSIDSENRISHCAPFSCRDGECLTTCKSTADCGPDFVCNPNNTQCEAVRASLPSTEDGGCGCRTTSHGSMSSGWLAALALLGHRLRRRGAGAGAKPRAPGSA